MKAIFLDVDGELTYSGYSNPDTHSIDVNKVLLLKEIVNRTNAVIVLSSTWKSGYNQKTGEKRNYYKVLEKILNDNGLQIYDITDDIPAKLSDENPSTDIMTLEGIINIKCVYGTGRGAEVKRWIDKHQPDTYVILDDENHDWEDYELDKNWIQPSWYDKDGGLHQEHVDKAIEILNKK